MKIFSGFNNETGSVLLVSLGILLLLTLVGIEMHSTSMDEVSIAGNDRQAKGAFYSAEAGLALAKSSLWMDYLNYASTNPMKFPGEVGSRETYDKFLLSKGILDGTTTRLARDLAIGTGQSVDSLDVSRDDLGGGIVLTVSSYGRGADNSSQTIRSVFTVAGQAFKGLDFAVLSNNINCIMCHATFDNVDRVYNNDPSKEGTFDRVKIASLESMLIRTDKADSYVAGTIYTRGIVTDKMGNIITNLSPSGGGVEGFEIDPTTGTILEPMNGVSLTNATGSPLPQNANMYMNYPTAEDDMTDGELPSDFPPPFPDNNGNHRVDQDEYDELAATVSGDVTGGVIYGVKSNQKYMSGSLPGSGNMTSVNGSYAGNLILVGTDANPIVINDDIAVDGDVIIQGVIKGTGQIFAKGNVYVTGDITYADGTDPMSGGRTFGKADDGTRNALSVAAGGNVMVGDYLTTKEQDIMVPAEVDPGNLSGGEKFSFSMSEITLFNRSEWTKSQEFLPNSSGGMVANSTYQPGYNPRYYTLNDGDPVYIYNKQNANGKGTYWDPATGSWMGKEHASSYDLSLLTKIDAGDPSLVGATTISLASSSNWITPQNLKSMWANDEASRASGAEFKIDGQLYTNNSVFALTRSRSATGGKMTINGAIVASDVGILVPTKLNVHYDPRLKEFLKIQDASKVTITRVGWYAE